jgi:hypothetical protein
LHIINSQLATHGLEGQWGSGLTDDLIQQPDAEGKINGFAVLDVRSRMVDAPNPTYVYRRLVVEGIEMIKQHGNVVVCCSAGMSRSNAIALGILKKHFSMSFEQAHSLVKKQVPIADISPCHLEQIKML